MTDATQIPLTLIAGDTWSWTRDLADYPAPTWVLTYYFQRADESFSIAATASGSSHLIAETAVSSAAHVPGSYRYFARVASGASVYTVDQGEIEIKPNPAAGKHDYRSIARKQLDAVQATLLGKASADQLAISIAGRSISRIPLPELRDYERDLIQKVRKEELGVNAGRGRNIKVRYGSRV